MFESEDIEPPGIQLSLDDRRWLAYGLSASVRYRYGTCTLLVFHIMMMKNSKAQAHNRDEVDESKVLRCMCGYGCMTEEMLQLHQGYCRKFKEANANVG